MAGVKPASRPTATAELQLLAERLRRAQRELEGMAVRASFVPDRDRLNAKAEGVALALSYVEEAIRA